MNAWKELRKRVQLGRKGRKGSGAVTGTSKTQGSPSKALPDAAFPNLPSVSPLMGILSVSIFMLLLAALNTVQTEHGDCYTCGERGSKKQKLFAT